MTHRIDSLAELTSAALDAFWHLVAQNFPEAVTGDLSLLAIIRLEEAALYAVTEWVENNVLPPSG